MMFSRSQPVWIACLLLVLNFATLILALPAPPTYPLHSRDGPVTFEPLPRRWSLNDGGTKPGLDRLRLRRRIINLPVQGASVVLSKRTGTPVIFNPKAKRAFIPSSSSSSIINPKKRSLQKRLVNTFKRSIPTSNPIPNPKMKRSLDQQASPPLVRPRSSKRDLLDIISTFMSTMKQRRRRQIIALENRDTTWAFGRRRPVVQNPKLRMLRLSLERRDSGDSDDSSDATLPILVPNPKSPRYSSVASVLSVSQALDTQSSSPVSSASSSTRFTDKSVAPSSTSSSSASSLLSSSTGISLTASSSSVSPTSTSQSTLASSTQSSSSTVSSTTKTTGKTTTKSSTTTSIKTTATSSKKTTTTTTTKKTTSSSTTKASTSVKASSTASSSSSSSWPTGDYISSAYYPDWDATIIPPREVDMSKFDLINFAFAIPTSSYGVEFEEDDTDVIAELVKYAHGNNTKIVISVGGWTDSVYFSGAVSTATNRAKFVKNIAAMVTKYDVDGIDIDWEYPGGGGADGNEVSTKDTANFLLFLQALRTSLGTDKLISACTTQTAFLGADGSPLTDVSAFGEVLDHILVMNYDVWGASSTPGPNAPLSDACSGSLQPTANEESAIATWTAAGMPASKILMGVPSYGYISSSTKTTLVHKRSEPTPTRPLDLDALPNHNRGYSNSGTYKSPMHRRWELGRARNKKRKEEERAAKLAAEKEQANSLAKRQTVIFCPNNHSGQPCEGVTNQTIKTIDWNPLNVTVNANGTVSGDGIFGGGSGVTKLGNGNLAAIDGNQIQFYELLSYGVIVESGATSTYTTYKGTNGYTLAWDTCSSTPYLYDVSRKVVITFDDPQSMVLKGQMAATKGIGGIGMWDISGDTPEWDLVNAFRVGMGLSS